MRNTSFLLVLFFFGSATAQNLSAQDNRPDQVRKFLLCDTEAFMALHMARSYFLDQKDKDQVIATFVKREHDLKLAHELFQKVDSDEIKHYADFAVHKLYACASRQGFEVGKPRGIARLCFARVDIPFFLAVLKSDGIGKKSAMTKVATTLTNREVYPEGLIPVVAEAIYSSASQEQTKKTMGIVFWSCLDRNNPSK